MTTGWRLSLPVILRAPFAMRLATLALCQWACLSPFALPLSAQEASPPDFSKQKLLLLFKEPKEEETAVDFETGMISFKGFGTSWRFLYLPMMMPWSGSPAAYRGLGQSFPDPFALTNTSLPFTARSWRDKRAMSAEMQRIERTERARARTRLKVNVRH